MDPAKDQTDQPTVAPDNQGMVPPASTSAGGIAKEVEPFSQDSINPSEQKSEISAELAEIGAEKVSETPQLTQEDTAVGIRVSDRSVEPVTITASSPVLIDPSMTEAQAITEVKRPDKTNSFVWRALTFIRALGKQRIKQKISTQNPL